MVSVGDFRSDDIKKKRKDSLTHTYPKIQLIQTIQVDQWISCDVLHCLAVGIESGRNGSQTGLRYEIRPSDVFRTHFSRVGSIGDYSSFESERSQDRKLQIERFHHVGSSWCMPSYVSTSSHLGRIESGNRNVHHGIRELPNHDGRYQE